MVLYGVNVYINFGHIVYSYIYLTLVGVTRQIIYIYLDNFPLRAPPITPAPDMTGAEVLDA